ncbi:hypothetical protein JS562_13520 [Agrobacterium sp. S2]|nr:hypothetical protein [Agrobacterium sp. S2]
MALLNLTDGDLPVSHVSNFHKRTADKLVPTVTDAQSDIGREDVADFSADR